MVFAAFDATAVADAPKSVSVASGNSQSAMQVQPLPFPVKVVVIDTYGNPTAGVEVAFTANNEGSSLPATAMTNAVGEAAAAWTLGPALGGQTLDAVVTGLPPVRFNATATIAPPSAPISITKIMGDLQTVVQHRKAAELSVRVIDVLGNGVPGIQVNFSATPGSGYVTPSTVTTDGWGLARWNEGGYFHTVGQQKVDASIAGFPPVTFTINITPNVHQFDGYYIGSYDIGGRHYTISFELVNGVYLYQTGQSGTFNEADGTITIVIGGNPRAVMSGQLVLDSLQNATGAGTYRDIPYTMSVPWTCERQ